MLESNLSQAQSLLAFKQASETSRQVVCSPSFRVLPRVVLVWE
jgi:hypothetical protein